MKRKAPFSFPENRSYQMSILSAFAMIFVVLGHIRFGINDMTEFGTFYGWFPYYSFHLPIFLFISGYFFKDLPDGHDAGLWKGIGRFLLHKAKTLLLPYYVITGLFLLFNNLLLTWGFTWPQPFTLGRWLLDPWTKPYILTLAVPAWYLISLFLAEVYFLFLRLTVLRLLKKCIKSDFPAESLLLIICLAAGVLALYVQGLPHISEAASVYLRSVLMLFFLQTGLLYRRHLEARDTLKSVPYFLILFLCQFLLLLFSANSPLNPGLYGLVAFEPFGYDYFLGGLTGTFLYLRISRLLASLKYQSRLVYWISSGTREIMAFHVFGFFVLNALLRLFLPAFRTARWKGYLYYTVTADPRMLPLYLFAGLGISLFIAFIIRLFKRTALRFIKS